jgi:transcriptional regulator with XRE-family HTH domain
MGEFAMTQFPTSALSERELLSYQADVRGQIFRQIHRVFLNLKQQGFTQRKFAKRLRMHPSQLSRIMKGDSDLRLETLSDLARALECRIEVRIIPIDVDALREQEESQAIIFDLDSRRGPTRAKKQYGTSASIEATPLRPDTWSEIGAMAQWLNRASRYDL